MIVSEFYNSSSSVPYYCRLMLRPRRLLNSPHLGEQASVIRSCESCTCGHDSVSPYPLCF